MGNPHSNSINVREFITNSIKDSRTPADMKELYKQYSQKSDIPSDNFYSVFLEVFGPMLGKAICSIVDDTYTSSRKILTPNELYLKLKEKHNNLANEDIFNKCILPRFDEFKYPTSLLDSSSNESLANKLDTE